ncbi:hypothetical protein BDR04DRAFT_1086038 [Suillus decipiens]|nr:hypothetical protein BDR04DRAFT_1086038 [Suillus decipiens]
MGAYWGLYTTRESSRIPMVWKELLGLCASGRIKPIIYDKILSLDEVTVELDALERQQTGEKVIVHIKDKEQGTVAKLQGSNL